MTPNHVLKFSLKDEHYLKERAERASAALASTMEESSEQRGAFAVFL